ncbi:hypothetical protein SK854_30215 [Lentzea sp. BCCO 10_0061]|uniref:Uncharacterized protein n=1 Tax=Lentzea sokolovensis TaxID=3095429 RepID=A0ABU4V3P6_9PSEU|nr:hypothetical protein [Lentzea sp. BCCO 10_0061]MDX8146423.1 hypothetical protein [Lentzea sp. BCCO 10_0061]
MTRPRPFEPIPTPHIAVGSRLLVGHYPTEPAIVVTVLDSPPDDPAYHVQLDGGRVFLIGGEDAEHPIIPWLWTPEHGCWVGEEAEPLAPYVPDFSARCFGPPLCQTCAEDLERMRAGDW